MRKISRRSCSDNGGSWSHAILAFAYIARLFGCIGEACFEEKKASKRHEWLEEGKEWGSKSWKRTIAAEKRLDAAVARLPLKANGSLLMHTRHCFARYVVLDPCYIFWSKLGFLAGRGARSRHNFSCRKIAEHCNCGFAAPKLAGLWHLGRIAWVGYPFTHINHLVLPREHICQQRDDFILGSMLSAFLSLEFDAVYASTAVVPVVGGRIACLISKISFEQPDNGRFPKYNDDITKLI